MKIPSALSRLNEALRCLPGVGSKSAARMSLHLLQTDRAGARALAEALAHAADHIVHCATCRNFTDNEICEICRDVRRDTTLICVVETPSDLLSIEATGLYTGLYHVLLGHLSPLDGVGPHQLGLDLLEDRVKSGQVSEVILATSSTVEGEATAHYIAQQMKAMNITVSSLARGVPMGGELDYVDSSTLAHAFKGRRPLE